MRRPLNGPAHLSLAIALLVACAPSDDCGEEPGELCVHARAPLRVQVGFRPEALALADLDADGHLDLAAASPTLGTVTVIWGAAAGLGEVATSWTVGLDAAGIVAADLDGDAHLDLATAVPGADAVAVLHGRGHRTFSSPRQHPTGAVPRALIAAQLDGAGPLELVTGNLGDGSVTVLRGLVAAPRVVVGPGPRALAAGDLDADGHIDLAVALADVDALQVMRGDGAGGLSPGPQYAVGAAPYAVVVADLDGDGALDLASADRLADQVSVLYGAGAAGLAGRATWPCEPSPVSLVVFADDDTPPALAVLSGQTANVQLIDAKSGPLRAGASPTPASALAAGDLDGDGQSELVGASAGGGRVAVLRPAEGLRLAPMWQGPPVYAAHAVDLEGDGVDELLVAARPGVAALWRGSPQATTELDLPLARPFSGALAGDLTGDGRRDVAVWDDDAALLLTARPDGGFVVTGGAPPPGSGGLRGAVLVDSDGDGTLELVGLHGKELRWMEADPAGGLQVTRTIDLMREFASVTPVDLDDDAPSDLMLLGYDDPLTLLEDAGTGPKRELLARTDDSLVDIALGDLDADGDLDALVCMQSGLYRVSRIFAELPGPREAWSAGRCSRVVVQDLDADDRLDALVFGRGLDTELLTPWIGGQDPWTALAPYRVHTEELPLRLARLAVDPLPAVVVADKDGATVALRATLGPALAESQSISLGANVRLGLGDLDGDGADDLVTVGDSVSVALADGRGGFGPVQQRSLAEVLPGATGPAPRVLLADFDDDGAEEVAAIIPSDIEFSSLLVIFAYDAEAGVSVRQQIRVPGADFGLRAGDLDRDGAIDLLTAGSGSIAWVRGRGDGSFLAPQPVPGPPSGLPSFWDGYILDLDGDGRLDLVGQNDSGLALVRWLDGVPGPLVAWSSAGGRQPLTVRDIDRDGRPDVMYAEYGRLVLLRGGEHAADPPRVLLTAWIEATAAADLDGFG